jgi:MraZ protein
VLKREFYAGHGLSAIGANGRVAIPASLRTTLETNNGNSRKFVMLARHAESPCLIGFDRARLDQINARIEAEEERERTAGRDYDYHTKMRRAFGQAEETPFDDSGRFILPSFLKTKGLLTDYAYFFAAGQFFDIWDARMLIANPKLNPDAAEGAEFFMREKGLL